ncbi:MAG TPA: deoxyribodipyrimidine photo-lyase [Bryobacteraceae bacterium]|nr:deoxyribodipyrimidine photo-lyase [Bryobacteraceae bacterium]
MPSLLWFRQDLRLSDNPALLAAVRRGGPVIPVFVWAPEEERPWAPGRASRWWLSRSLAALDATLRHHGSRLVVRRGPTLKALVKLAAETGADKVFWSRRYEPAAAARDEKVKAAIASETFESALLFEPGRILNRAGRPFQVFSAFWRACQSMPEPGVPERAPTRIPAPSRWPKWEPVPDVSAAIEGWNPGEAGAQEQFQRFLKRAGSYATDRDRPGHEGTSRLSPHLHFGEIGPRQIWHALRSNEAYLRELAWREFAYHLLFHFPRTPDEPFRPRHREAPSKLDARSLRLWRTGRTGYPIVDAGMRQLLETGWMHNRVRMLVASFLVKDLLIDWREGAAWFWDNLVDADLANNTLNWQWVAGCGADASPWFRIFNPVTQGEKFDPQGDYVRRWLPQLQRLPAAWIHKPWDAPASVVQLGRTYPRPIVNRRVGQASTPTAGLQTRPSP